MALRNILVHLAEDNRCGERIALACDLAARDDGMVTGLFVRPYPIIIPAVMPDGGEFRTLGMPFPRIRPNKDYFHDSRKFQPQIERKRVENGAPSPVVNEHTS